MKDSRLGAFGALAMMLLMSGQALACAIHIEAALSGEAWQNLPILALAPVWGRVSPAWLAWRAKAHAKPSLGALVCGHMTGRIFTQACAIGAICLILPMLAGMALLSALAICAAELAAIMWLKKTAKRHGGLSGDFFGCGIEASQLIFLAAAA